MEKESLRMCTKHMVSWTNEQCDICDLEARLKDAEEILYGVANNGIDWGNRARAYFKKWGK